MLKRSIEIVHNQKNIDNKPKKLMTQNKSDNFVGPGGQNVFLKASIETVKYYCRESTIHGLRYLVDANEVHENFDPTKAPSYMKYLKKIVFCGICLFLGLGCLYMIFIAYERYATTPTLTSIETRNYPIYMVPFPAVTFCNVNKVYKPVTANFTDILSAVGVERALIDDFLEKLSSLFYPIYLENIYLNIYRVLESMGYNSKRLMEELAQPCNNMMKSCFWLGREIPCHSIFRTIESSEGFCCSFNYHASKMALSFFGPTSTMKYDSNNESLNKLLYVAGAGSSVGLAVLLDIEEETYVSATRPYYGVSIAIHNPQTHPGLVNDIAQPGEDIHIQVAPSVTVSDDAIRSLPIELRLCYFEDEKKLRTTETYTFESCMAECKVDTILDLCGCIPFYFPETSMKEFSSRFRQCNLRDVNCLRLNEHIYNSVRNNSSVSGVSEDGMNCECLPTCSEKQYFTHLVSGQRTHAITPKPMFLNLELSNLTTVHVYFKELTCIKYRRDVYMTWDILFAVFGGIFGFCLGGSVLSLLEFAYHFIFTIWLFLIVESRKWNNKPKSPPTNYFIMLNELDQKQNVFGYSRKNPFKIRDLN